MQRQMLRRRRRRHRTRWKPVPAIHIHHPAVRLMLRCQERRQTAPAARRGVSLRAGYGRRRRRLLLRRAAVSAARPLHPGRSQKRRLIERQVLLPQSVGAPRGVAEAVYVVRAVEAVRAAARMEGVVVELWVHVDGHAHRAGERVQPRRARLQHARVRPGAGAAVDERCSCGARRAPRNCAFKNVEHIGNEVVRH